MSQLGTLCLAAGLLWPLAAGAGETRTYDKASFYFVAHEDDWQLFMNPSAFLDVADRKTKTVFVHVTAGDAGSGTGSRGRKHPFYLARENGAEAAIRFMADANDMPIEKKVRYKTLNGHSIYRVAYRNTVSYFLRVPDGNANGAGYAETGNESLQRLATRQSDRLRAIDGSTVYRGWSDLTATLRALVDYERGDVPAVDLNVGETDAAINPGDHSDHQMTAKAALDATNNLSCLRRVYYVDYASARLPENLNPKQRDMESAVFAVTAAAIRAMDHSSAWHHYNDTFVGRSYFRVEDGKGFCEAPRPEIASARQKTAAATPQLVTVRQR